MLYKLDGEKDADATSLEEMAQDLGLSEEDKAICAKLSAGQAHGFLDWKIVAVEGVEEEKHSEVVEDDDDDSRPVNAYR